MNFKKITAAITAAAILAVAAPVTGVLPDAMSVMASAEESLDGFKFRTNEFEAYLVRYTGNATNVQIPSTFNGKPVSNIQGGAFAGCKNLISVTIPITVTNLGTSVFANCTSLAEINVAEGNTKYYSNDSVLYEKADGKAFAVCACAGGKSGEITIPNTVTKIYDNAFNGCTKLISITIPNSVTEIGSHAFVNCTSLTSVTIPNGVTEIAWGTFYNCTSLSSVSIPDSVNTINDDAFYDCTSLISITIPEGVKSIGHAFIYSSNANSFLRNVNGIPGSYAETFAAEHGFTFNGNSFVTPVTPDPVTPVPITPVPVNPAPQKSIYKSETDVLGDVDGDGKTSAKDATAILKYTVGLAEFEGNSLNNALVTGGEKPSARDATQILKMAVGLA